MELQLSIRHSLCPAVGPPRKTLKERIPEISEVVAIDQEQEPLTESGIEEAPAACLQPLSLMGHEP